MDHAAFSKEPTLGIPPATVNPIAPDWYIGAFFKQTWLPVLMSVVDVEEEEPEVRLEEGPEKHEIVYKSILKCTFVLFTS